MKKKYTQVVHIDKTRINEFSEAIMIAPKFHSSRGIQLPLDMNVMNITYKDKSVINCCVENRWNEMSKDERMHLIITHIDHNGKITDEKIEMIYTFRHFLEMINNLSVESGGCIYDVQLMVDGENNHTSLSSILKEHKCVYKIPEEYKATVIAEIETIKKIGTMIDLGVGEFGDEIPIYDCAFEDGMNVSCTLKFNEKWRLVFEYENEEQNGGCEVLVDEGEKFYEQISCSKIIVTDKIYRMNLVIKEKDSMIPASILFTDQKNKSSLFWKRIHTHSLLCTLIIIIVSKLVFGGTMETMGFHIWMGISLVAMIIVSLSAMVVSARGVLNCLKTKKALRKYGVKQSVIRTVSNLVLKVYPVLIAAFVCLRLLSILFPLNVELMNWFNIYSIAFLVTSCVIVVNAVRNIKTIMKSQRS